MLLKIIHEISNQHTKRSPIVLTIGFFDGVHLGHQKIFETMNSLKGEHGQSVVLTFENHPQTVLKPGSSLSLINTLQQRTELIRSQDIDLLVLLPFDEEIKSLSCDDFLMNLHEHIPFDHLVLGPDSTIGHKKEGDADLIKLLSRKYSFEFTQVDFVNFEKERISSSRIRKLIEEGKLDLVEKQINRPYSIKAPIIEGEQIGQKMGFPTLNLNVEDLALPPLGVYKVYVLINNEKHLGVANLGYAPTVQDRKDPVLEVHILEGGENFKDTSIEMEFSSYIRSEKKFSSIDELKNQIQKDIEAVKSM